MVKYLNILINTSSTLMKSCNLKIEKIAHNQVLFIKIEKKMNVCK